MHNFRKRDSQKTKEIKAITNDDGRTLEFKREMVQANERWLNRTHTMARNMARQRGRNN